MINPPAKIGEANLICHVVIDIEKHFKTGNTEHYVPEGLVEDIYGLAICKYENDPGYYLFYCDTRWMALADTYHETVEAAKDQAEFEFVNTHNEWICI